jgi:hypothetical protein
VEAVNPVSIIENTNLSQIQGTLQKISQFQALVQSQLKQNHDFGIIPGTPKPTLLKPGAEKILMLLGLTSEFEIIDSTRDFEKGFFQYQVRCRLYKNGMVITEGLGSCNTKERKYVKQDPFSVDNTVLKMGKKRALIDATLLVASLSEVFTQDIEDMDLNGANMEDSLNHSKQATDNGATITAPQAKRIFALAKGDADLVKTIIGKYGYTRSDEIKKIDYSKICEEIEQQVKIETEAGM